MVTAAAERPDRQVRLRGAQRMVRASRAHRWATRLVVVAITAMGALGWLGGGRGVTLQRIHTHLSFFEERTAVMHQMFVDTGFRARGPFVRPFTTDLGAPRSADVDPWADLERFFPTPTVDGDRVEVVLGTPTDRGSFDPWARHWLTPPVAPGDRVDARVLVGDPTRVVPRATVVLEGVEFRDPTCSIEGAGGAVCLLTVETWGVRLQVADLPAGASIRFRGVVERFVELTDRTNAPIDVLREPAPPWWLVALNTGLLALLAGRAAVLLRRSMRGRRGRLGMLLARPVRPGVAWAIVAATVVAVAGAVITEWSNDWVVAAFIVIGAPFVVAHVTRGAVTPEPALAEISG